MSEEHPCCQSHCCVKHGCKYGHPDCPVVLGSEVQDDPCEECGNERMELGAGAGQIVLDRTELLRVLNENKHLLNQVTELQMAMNMKEEHLRAHRRMKLTDEQQKSLEEDLKETTERVQKGYEALVKRKGA